MSAAVDMDRFWSKVDKSGECWVWTGARDGHGYGHISRWIDGRARNFKAHRYVLMLDGQDVDGRDVDHKCHNRACVNPEHLRLVTRKQNLENHSGARSDSKSGIRGVYFCNTFHKWYGCVVHLGKTYRKSFATPEAANDWVVAKRVELFTHNDVDRCSHRGGKCRCGR